MRNLRKIITIVSAMTPYSVEVSADLAPVEIRMALKYGHIQTCGPTISSQLQLFGLTADEGAVSGYCACLGILYFDDITVDEAD